MSRKGALAPTSHEENSKEEEQRQGQTVRAEIKQIYEVTLVVFYMYNAEKFPSVPSQWSVCSDQGNSLSILKQLYE